MWPRVRYNEKPRCPSIFRSSLIVTQGAGTNLHGKKDTTTTLQKFLREQKPLTRFAKKIAQSSHGILQIRIDH